MGKKVKEWVIVVTLMFLVMMTAHVMMSSLAHLI